MGYKTVIISYKIYQKQLCVYPRPQFFKASCDSGLTDETINLLSFEVWIKKRVQDFFNSLA